MESSRCRSSSFVLSDLLNHLKGISVDDSGMRIIKDLSLFLIIHDSLFSSVILRGRFEVDGIADILLPLKDFSNGVVIPMAVL